MLSVKARWRWLWVVSLVFVVTSCRKREATTVRLLNVSYDPTRELYVDVNRAFARHWAETNDEVVSVQQSHGGSGKQARAVIDGLEADVVTLALDYDVNAIQKRGLLVSDWKQRLPRGSAPYTSIIVLLVRAGNPRGVRDFGDLAREGVAVITPNPKTGGGARLNYLALWAHALRSSEGDETRAIDFVRRVYRNVPVLDSGARGSTTTFVERGIGDVLITWENEARMALSSFPNQKLELVVPKRTLLAEPPVAWVDEYTAKHGTTRVARAYLEYLYSEPAQEIISRHGFRPHDEKVMARHRNTFPNVELCSVDSLGGIEALHQKHFSDGGIFDRIFEKH